MSEWLLRAGVERLARTPNFAYHCNEEHGQSVEHVCQTRRRIRTASEDIHGGGNGQEAIIISDARRESLTLSGSAPRGECDYRGATFSSRPSRHKTCHQRAERSADAKDFVAVREQDSDHGLLNALYDPTSKLSA